MTRRPSELLEVLTVRLAAAGREQEVTLVLSQSIQSTLKTVFLDHSVSIKQRQIKSTPTNRAR